MSLFSIDTFYFLSLGIIGLLIVLLIFHFRNKIVLLEKQVHGLHGIATELVNDVKRANILSVRKSSDSLENVVLKKKDASSFDVFDFSKQQQPILEDNEEDEDDDDDDEDDEDDDDDEEDEFMNHPAPPIVIGSVIDSGDLNVQEVVATSEKKEEECPTGDVLEEVDTVEILQEDKIVEEDKILEEDKKVEEREFKVVEEEKVEEDDNMTVATTESLSKWSVSKLRHYAHYERGIDGVAKMKKSELLVLLKE